MYDIPQPANSTALPSSTAIRLRYLATNLHRLGPRPLYELLAELVQGQPVMPPRLEVYGALDVELIHTIGADQMPPRITILSGGRS
jgi:hypothetical protein